MPAEPAGYLLAVQRFPTVRHTAMPTKTTRHFIRPGSRVALIALVAGLVLAFPAPQSAHDIPGDVTIQAFVKPEGQRLRLLVRVPLEALSDMALKNSCKPI